MNGHLAALLIGYKLDSGHRQSSPWDSVLTLILPPLSVNPIVKLDSGVIWSAGIPAKAGIHALAMVLPLWTSPSGPEMIGPNGCCLPLDSRFRGNDCLHRPARKFKFPQMTPL